MATIIDFVAMVIFAPFFQALKQVFGIESPAKEMKPIGQYIMEGIFQGIIDTLVDIVTWVKTNMFDPVVNAIKSIFGINSPAEEMKPLGVSIIEGLLQGIIDTLVGIVTWVQTNIFNPVINAIKSVFGINSPAEETKPLGKNIMAGILQGVIDKLSDIVTWTKQHIFTPMMDALKSVFGIDRDNASELEPTGKSFIKGIFKGISDNITDFVTNIGGFAATVADAFDTWVDGVVGKFTSMMSSISTNISAWVGGLGTTIATGISNAIDAAKGAFSGVVTFVTGGDDKKKMPGHATGGIFSREHVARIAENNRTEAIIPMEDTGAMQPFVDAVSDGIAQSLAPTLLALANSGNGSGVAQNLLVGTLIADDRGLKELERRMNIIKYNENDRRGI
jgi:phage-related protein